MKKLVLIVLLIVVALPLAVSVKAQEQPLKITFVTHDLGAGVFAPVRKGMEDACKAVNAECEFLGPQSYNPEEQVKILEAVVAKKPDGIATTRPVPGTYDKVLKDAVDAGIKVVTFNTNDPTADKTLPLPFVGQDFTNYGKVWGRELIKAMPNGGKIAITTCCPGHYALEERIRSLRETLDTEAPGKFTVVQVINTGAEASKIVSAIEAFYQANQDINGIVGSDFFTYAIAEFAKSNGLQKKFVVAGEISPLIVDGLKVGYVSFALGQGPYLQGYYPVQMIALAKRLNINTPNIDSGTDVVTPENINQYNPDYR
jgi:ABC-type sugar transport system substrate-binding protein